MSEERYEPCCLCGKPVLMVKNGYTCVWDYDASIGRDRLTGYAHDTCTEGTTKPMEDEELARAMKPTVDAALEALKKLFQEH